MLGARADREWDRTEAGMSEPGAAGAGMKRVWGWVKKAWGQIKIWRWLKTNWWITLVLIVLAGALVAISSWNDIAEFARGTHDASKPADISNLDILRNFGLVLAGFLGVIFTWWRSSCLGRQTTISEQGLITDRFIKATEQLGSETESVRIGAVYSLWRIAVDTPAQSDKIAVLDMLCAFVRSSKKKEESNKESDTKSDAEERLEQDASKDSTKDKEMDPIREDIHIAVKLLAKRRKELRLKKDANNGKEYRLDLQGAWLVGADLAEANLVKADLRGTKLWGAKLGGADLGGADLVGANLVVADLGWAKLGRAILIGAILRKAYLWEADLREADLGEADLREAYLGGAHLERAILRGAKLEKTDFKDARLTKTRFSSRKALANVRNVGGLSQAIFVGKLPFTKPTPPDAEET